MNWKHLHLITAETPSPGLSTGPGPGFRDSPGWQSLRPPSEELVGFYGESHESTRRPEAG